MSATNTVLSYDDQLSFNRFNFYQFHIKAVIHYGFPAPDVISLSKTIEIHEMYKNAEFTSVKQTRH